MNASLQSRLSEVGGTNNIAYILQDNNDFSVTGYKVMQNQSGAGLLRCAKITYNGKSKLVYIIDQYKPLSYVATRLGVTELNVVIYNLIQRVMDIKDNGFFKAENLELDFNKIFVDTSDYSVHLIYFPLSGGNTGKISAFENEFRVALINLFNSFPVFNAPQFQRLCSDLSNGSLPTEMILKKLRGVGNNGAAQQIGGLIEQQPVSVRQMEMPVTPSPRQPIVQSNQIYQGGEFRMQNQHPQDGQQNQPYQSAYQAVPQVSQPPLTVSAVNSPVQMILTVNQPEYLIGKNPNMVNGAITHNPAISRVHCKIYFACGRYYLMDMGSANGTFVNQKRLENQQPVEIHSGDYLRLANSDFIISF